MYSAYAVLGKRSYLFAISVYKRIAKSVKLRGS